MADNFITQYVRFNSFCYVINFDIFPGFLSKPFSYMIKNSEQIMKYFKNKKGF